MPTYALPSPTKAAATNDVATHLKRLVEPGGASTEWCRSDQPSEQGFYMRAFVHRIHEYRCQYFKSSADTPQDVEYLGKLKNYEERILKACGVEPQPFKETWCFSGVPKDIPAPL